MRVLVLRFEKDALHYLIIDDLGLIDNQSFEINKITLATNDSIGEKYSRVLDELDLIVTKMSFDIIVYQSALYGQKGIDEMRFANEAFLNYFCYKKNIVLLELNKVICRRKLDIKKNVFDSNFNDIEDSLLTKKCIPKSNKLFEGLVLLYLIKDII